MIVRVIVGLLNIESPSQKLKSEYQPLQAVILCDSAQKEKTRALKKVTRGAGVVVSRDNPSTNCRRLVSSAG
jgi:hypothetical protein